jgi:hypothetical protein
MPKLILLAAAFILAAVSIANAGYWLSGPNGPVYVPTCYWVATEKGPVYICY